MRFVHVAAAGIWLGMQVTLLVFVPALRRILPPEQVRDAARRSGRDLAAAGDTALLAVAASGVALSHHEASAGRHPGVVDLKEVLFVAIVALFGSHAAVRGRTSRLAASALMLGCTVAAMVAGSWLAGT